MAGLSWLVTVATAMAAGLACYASNFKFAHTLFPFSLVQAMFGAAVYLFYLFFRNDFFILSVANGVAALSAFSFASLVFSYAALHYSIAFETKDATLASIDAAFGLDWFSLVRWANGHQWIAGIMDIAYDSIPFQTLGALMVLSLLGRYRRLQMLVLAIQVSVLICAIVTVFIPAMGEYAYLKINLPLEFPGLPSVATSYVAPVAEIVQLRTSAPQVQLDRLMGVITFPSFHAAAALLFIWVMWRVAVVRWLSLFLNGIMLIATPVFGGHYFADVAAGLLVATLSIWIAYGAVHFFQKKERDVSVASKTEVAFEQLAN